MIKISAFIIIILVNHLFIIEQDNNGVTLNDNSLNIHASIYNGIDSTKGETQSVPYILILENYHNDTSFSQRFDWQKTYKSNLETHSDSSATFNIAEHYVGKDDEHTTLNTYSFKLRKRYSWFIEILILIILVFVSYYIIKKISNFKKRIISSQSDNTKLKKENLELIKRLQQKNEVIQNIESLNKSNHTNIVKTKEDAKLLNKQIKRELDTQNTLNENELLSLTENQENRWVTVAHSSIGKNHINANPSIPCQDNNHFESLDYKWEMAVVCDGAGSAKMSHFGSKFISQGALPNIVKAELKDLVWFKKGIMPSREEWNKLSISILKKSLLNLKIWVQDQNKKHNTEYSINEFATTVILVIYSAKGILITHIGDGRGGYLNKKGKFKALFTPFEGNESNSTIFISSPIWEAPTKYIESKVVSEDILSVFILSDGMEKTAFECSSLIDNVFIDANTPHKKFFYPILLKIKQMKKADEKSLAEEWKEFIKQGNELIKNEGDDKTLLLSFLK